MNYTGKLERYLKKYTECGNCSQSVLTKYMGRDRYGRLLCVVCVNWLRASVSSVLEMRQLDLFE